MKKSYSVLCLFLVLAMFCTFGIVYSFADGEQGEIQNGDLTPENATDTMVSPEPKTFKTQKSAGTKVLLTNYAMIPVGLGEPKLSDEEIDALLENTDYEYVADQLTTLADVVSYVIRGDYVFGDGLLWQKEGTCGALQTMELRVGQCASMSSLFSYLLQGDYDEVGYIALSGHAMIYILQDGIYYLINPVAYTRNEENESHKYMVGYHPETNHGSSANFQDLADALVRDFQTKYVLTWVSPEKTWGCVYDSDKVKVWYEEPNSVPFKNQKISNLPDQTEYHDVNEIVTWAGDKASSVAQAHTDREHMKYFRGW